MNGNILVVSCIGSFISVDRLESMVIAELNRLSSEYLDKGELEENIEFCSSLQQHRDRILSDIFAYEKKLDEFSKALRDTYIDKVKGVISEKDYIDFSKSFAVDKERLELTIRDSRKQLEDIDYRIAAGDNRRAIIEKYTNLDHLTREMVELLIDYISVGKRIPGTRNVPIEIHWNF